MKSKTKMILSDVQIIMLVKEQFGKDTQVKKITDLKGGMCNAVYLIEKSGEYEKVVLKVSAASGTPLLWHEGDNMYTEIEAYKLISEQTTIPVPKILFYDFSKKLISGRYFFREYLTGEEMHKLKNKIKPENKDEIKKKMGEYVAQIHKIKGSYFGYITPDQSRQYKTWEEANKKWFSMILLDAKKRGYRLPFDRIENAMKSKYKYLEVIKEPRLIHNDFWAANVFLQKNGEKYEVQAITDLERAVFGDPLAEFHYNGFIIEDVWKEPVFWKSYAEAAGINKEISKDEMIRMHIYKLYLWLIMVAESYRYPALYGKMQRSFSKRFVMKNIKYLEAN